MAVVGSVLGAVFSIIVSAGRIIVSGATMTLSWLFHFVMDWIVPKVVWLVQQVTNIVNWMSKVFDTVSSMIGKAVGKVIEYIDKSIALVDKVIADVVDMILEKLNIESKLLREWMIWYIEQKLKPIYDGLAMMRRDFFQMVIDVRNDLNQAISNVKDYFSVQVEWLDQRITINTDNWKAIFTDYGLIKPEKSKQIMMASRDDIVDAVDAAQAYELSTVSILYLTKQTPWKMIVSESEKIAKWSGVTVEYIDTERERIEEVAFV